MSICTSLLAQFSDASEPRGMAALELAKPVSSHALPCPLSLTHPAPVEVAGATSAHHVHASSITLSWCATLGTGFGSDTNG